MTLQKFLTVLCAAAFSAAGVAWVQKGRLPHRQEILKDMARPPAQGDLNEKPFAFAYRGKPYNVKPMASYVLRGLVVSHNNPQGFADIYHDADSLDTKDVCVVWGDNLQTDDYRNVKFWNGPWTCNWRYDGEVFFRNDQISNNHLITQSDDIRRRIDGVRIGDQIQVEGWLVAYQDAAHPDFWRTSSMTRGDTGNGACEVFLVKKLQVLKAGNPQWYSLYSWGLWAGAGALLAKILAGLFL